MAIVISISSPKFSGKTWAANIHPTAAKFLFDRRDRGAAVNTIALIDPEAPLVTGAPVAVVFDQNEKDICYGRLATKHPAKAKLLDITVMTVNGERLLKRLSERASVHAVVGVSYLELT